MSRPVCPAGYQQAPRTAQGLVNREAKPGGRQAGGARVWQGEASGGSWLGVGGGCPQSDSPWGQSAPRPPAERTRPPARCLPHAADGPAHLAQANGVVEGLRSRVETHRLPHLLLALVLAGHVVGGGPVSRLVGYFSSLEAHRGPAGLCPHLPAPGMCPAPPTEQPTFWMLPWKQWMRTREKWSCASS